MLNKLPSFAWRTFKNLEVDELYAILELRSQVFVVEQQCVFLDIDGADTEALHLLARAEPSESTLCGYLRLLPPGPDGLVTLGRVVTPAFYRSAGLGSALVEEGMRYARAHFSLVGFKIAAQAHLESFYSRLGFRRQSANYLDAGLQHVDMLAEA